METVKSILEANKKALESDLSQLEMAFDDCMISETEYYNNKASIKAKVRNNEDLYGMMRMSGLIQEDETVSAQLIGRNGTIRMFMTNDHDIYIETSGVVTKTLINPLLSEVEEWKKVLGIK